MALDIHFTVEIAHDITATAIAMLCAVTATGENVEYCRGVIDFARARTTQLGIPWPSVSSEIRQALADAGRCELLEAVGRLEG